MTRPRLSLVWEPGSGLYIPSTHSTLRESISYLARVARRVSLPTEQRERAVVERAYHEIEYLCEDHPKQRYLWRCWSTFTEQVTIWYARETEESRCPKSTT